MSRSPRAVASRPAGASVPAGRARLITWLMLTAIVVFWGGNWVLLKLALPDIEPMTFTAIRLAGSTAVCTGLLLAARQPLLPPQGERAAIGISGFLQIGSMLGLSMIALQHVAPGRAAVLGYTMQLWALPLGVWLLGERITGRKLLGAGAGFAGLVLFFNPALVDWGDPQAMFGNGLLLAAAMGWALGACLYRRRVWQGGFWTQTNWQILVSTVPVAVLALLLEQQSIRWTPTLIGVLVFNWFIATGFCFWCWARVLAVMPAFTAGQAVMMVPVFAFLLSAMFFAEPVTASALASIGLIVAGLLLTLHAKAPRPPVS